MRDFADHDRPIRAITMGRLPHSFSLTGSAPGAHGLKDPQEALSASHNLLTNGGMAPSTTESDLSLRTSLDVKFREEVTITGRESTHRLVKPTMPTLLFKELKRRGSLYVHKRAQTCSLSSEEALMLKELPPKDTPEEVGVEAAARKGKNPGLLYQVRCRGPTSELLGGKGDHFRPGRLQEGRFGHNRWTKLTPDARSTSPQSLTYFGSLWFVGVQNHSGEDETGKISGRIRFGTSSSAPTTGDTDPTDGGVDPTDGGLYPPEFCKLHPTDDYPGYVYVCSGVVHGGVKSSSSVADADSSILMSWWHPPESAPARQQAERVNQREAGEVVVVGDMSVLVHDPDARALPTSDLREEATMRGRRDGANSSWQVRLGDPRRLGARCQSVGSGPKDSTG